MKLGRRKWNADDRVTYQGKRATILSVSVRTVEIRDAYGYVRNVPKSEISPWHE